jgi:hypothetical protein
MNDPIRYEFLQPIYNRFDLPYRSNVLEKENINILYSLYVIYVMFSAHEKEKKN